MWRLHERVQGQLRRAVAPPQREPPDGEAERPRNEAGLRWQLLHSTPHRTREGGGLYWDAIGANGRPGHARLEEDQMPPRALRAPILDSRLPPVGHPDARVEQTSAHPFARALAGLARALADVWLGRHSANKLHFRACAGEERVISPNFHFVSAIDSARGMWRSAARLISSSRPMAPRLPKALCTQAGRRGLHRQGGRRRAHHQQKQGRRRPYTYGESLHLPGDEGAGGERVPGRDGREARHDPADQRRRRGARRHAQGSLQLRLEYATSTRTLTLSLRLS